MTPKEKSEELVDKFCATRLYDEQGKECALIAVDEILKEHFGDDSEYGTRRYYYFKEVEKEINKL